MMEKDPYSQVGVSARKEGVHQATKDLDKGIFPGAFCKVQPYIDENGQENTELAEIFHADGIGTKVNVAYLARREGYGPEIYRTIAYNALVMNTDDLLCNGVVNNIRVINYIAKNPNRISQVDYEEIIKGYMDFIRIADAYGIKIYETGGETADMGATTSTLDMNVVAYAKIRRDQVIDASKVPPESIIVGLASNGQSTYEDKPNSGLRSNGYSLAIPALLHPYYRKYPEVIDQAIDNSFRPHNLKTWKYIFDKKLFFTGPYKLEDMYDDIGTGERFTILEALISPTRTYLPIIKACIEEDVTIQGIIHNSGGGMTKSIGFGDGIRYVKQHLLLTPAIFHLIQGARDIEDKYMYQTFNMGTGMEIIVPNEEEAKKIIEIAERFNVRAKVIGYTEKAKTNANEVVIETRGKVLEYKKEKH